MNGENLFNSPITPEERIGILFERLQRAFPFDSAMVAAAQPGQIGHVPLVNRGYDPGVAQHLTEEYILGDPTFRLQASQRTTVYHWDNIPDFRSTEVAEEVLMPAGYRQGTSIILEDGSGTTLGMLHVQIGDKRFPEQLVELMPALRRGLADILSARHIHSNLSEREREVLHYVARGLSNTEIAERLYLSQGTVRTHVQNILPKVGARNRVQASLRVFGLLDPLFPSDI